MIKNIPSWWLCEFKNYLLHKLSVCSFILIGSGTEIGSEAGSFAIGAFLWIKVFSIIVDVSPSDFKYLK